VVHFVKLPKPTSFLSLKKKEKKKKKKKMDLRIKITSFLFFLRNPALGVVKWPQKLRGSDLPTHALLLPSPLIPYAY
jgi:hypothetical protein